MKDSDEPTFHTRTCQTKPDSLFW